MGGERTAEQRFRRSGSLRLALVVGEERCGLRGQFIVEVVFAVCVVVLLSLGDGGLAVGGCHADDVGWNAVSRCLAQIRGVTLMCSGFMKRGFGEEGLSRGRMSVPDKVQRPLRIMQFDLRPIVAGYANLPLQAKREIADKRKRNSDVKHVTTRHITLPHENNEMIHVVHITSKGSKCLIHAPITHKRVANPFLPNERYRLISSPPTPARTQKRWHPRPGLLHSRSKPSTSHSCAAVMARNQRRRNLSYMQ